MVKTSKYFYLASDSNERRNRIIQQILWVFSSCKKGVARRFCLLDWGGFLRVIGWGYGKSLEVFWKTICKSDCVLLSSAILSNMLTSILPVLSAAAWYVEGLGCWLHLVDALSDLFEVKVPCRLYGELFLLKVIRRWRSNSFESSSLPTRPLPGKLLNLGVRR